VLSAFFFAFSPFVWVYGRNFQGESLALMLLSLSVYGILRPSWRWCSGLAMGVSATLRLHFLAVVPALLCFFPAPSKVRSKVVWTIVCLVIPILWHAHNLYMQNHYPNVHSTMFMQLQMGKTFPHPYLLKPRYYLFFLKNFVGWSAGPVGFVFAAWAMWQTLRGSTRRRWIFMLALTWVVVILIPDKFYVQHFYAYDSILPMSILAGVGLSHWLKKRSAFTLEAVLALALGTSFVIAYHPTYKVTTTDLAVFPAAKFIHDVVPKDALLIASHGASSDLVYYGDHLGWPFSILPHTGRALSVDMGIRIRGGPSQAEFDERNNAYRNSIRWLEYLRGLGAKYFVVSQQEDLNANPALKEYLDSHFELISKSHDPFCAYKLAGNPRETR